MGWAVMEWRVGGMGCDGVACGWGVMERRGGGV